MENVQQVTSNKRRHICKTEAAVSGEDEQQTSDDTAYRTMPDALFECIIGHLKQLDPSSEETKRIKKYMMFMMGACRHCEDSGNPLEYFQEDDFTEMYVTVLGQLEDGKYEEAKEWFCAP